ncbi:Protamine-3 [Manis pentadactyla]|nr:Protamine-3 [Manis pentadactyla]
MQSFKNISVGTTKVKKPDISISSSPVCPHPPLCNSDPNPDPDPKVAIVVRYSHILSTAPLGCIFLGLALPPRPQRQPKKVMGSHLVKLSTGGGRGHKPTMKKLVACVSQDSFSLPMEGEEQEQREEEEGEEELLVQGKLLLMEPEQ